MPQPNLRTLMLLRKGKCKRFRIHMTKLTNTKTKTKHGLIIIKLTNTETKTNHDLCSLQLQSTKSALDLHGTD